MHLPHAVLRTVKKKPCSRSSMLHGESCTQSWDLSVFTASRSRSALRGTDRTTVVRGWLGASLYNLF